jgi:hypothetical protein
VGKRTKVYTDHKNLIQDAIGFPSDHVYWWRLLLQEYGPKIVHIKGIQNTGSVAISRLDYSPIIDNKANWMTFTKCWLHYTTHIESVENTYNHQEQVTLVFANRNEDDAIYPLAVRVVPQAQKHDTSLKKLNTHDKYRSLMQRWKNFHPRHSSKLCSQLVPPLPAAPWTHKT